MPKPCAYRWSKEESGFTYIELVIVILILAILTGIAVVSMSFARERVNKSACKANVRTIMSALETYKAEHDGEYPPQLGLLTNPNPGDSHYLKESFQWLCPSGPLNGDSADYRDHYNPSTGEVTCPRPSHNL